MAEPRFGDDAALRALEDRLDRAAATAERLLAQAQGRGRGEQGPAGAPPPAGWQRRPGEADGDDGLLSGWMAAGDAELLLTLLSGVRDRLPDDLQQRLLAAVRELLLALRALIDWCLERTQRPPAADVERQDIPIL